MHVLSWARLYPFAALAGAVLFLVLTIVLPLQVAERASLTYQLSFELTSDRSTLGQVFFAKDAAYSEADSESFSVLEGKHQYQVRLRLSKPQGLGYIRFDPSLASASGALRNIAISSGSTSLTARDLRLSFKALHAIELNELEVGSVKFVATSADPYFELRLDPRALEDFGLGQPFPTFVAMLGFLLWWVVVAGIVFAPKLQKWFREPGGFYCFCLLLLGGVLIVLIPSFQSPDEFKHFERANMIAEGDIGVIVRDGSVGGFVRPELGVYMGQFSELPFHPENTLSAQKVLAAADVRWGPETTFVKHVETLAYLPFVYIPQALAVATGQALDLTVHHTYLLARLMNLLATLSLIATAFYIVKPSLAVLLTLAMPMMLFQMTATTIDGLTVGLALVCLSLSVRLISKVDKDHWHFSLLLVGLLLLTGARPYLLPMYLIPLYVSVRPLDWSRVWMSVTVAVLSVCWVLFATTQAVDERVDVGASRIDVLGSYLSDPMQFVILLENTIQHFSSNYFRQFVGVLGWLDTDLPGLFYSVAGTSLLLSLMLLVARKWSRPDFVQFILLFSVSIGSGGLVFVALLISWSEHPAVLIQGVQGRYFTIPLLVLIYGLMQKANNLDRRTLLVSLVFLMLSATVLTHTLLVRYYL